MLINRIIPIPPNFSKIPAKIIEPNTGASTWAKGSHKWTPNIGNLTKNPNATANDETFLIILYLELVPNRFTSENNDMLTITVTQTTKGTDEIIV